MPTRNRLSISQRVSDARNMYKTARVLGALNRRTSLAIAIKHLFGNSKRSSSGS